MSTAIANSESKGEALRAENESKNKSKSQSAIASVIEKIPYPKAAIFIIITEFCERFSYYGVRAVLSIYLKNELGYSDDTATQVFHLFVMLSYFSPLLGAMLADSFLGKFRTILYLGIVYACGGVLLALAATPPLSLPTEAFSMIGLVLIAFGTGCIKPCVAAFGGDQFKLPQQEKQLTTFFALFYFAINSGSLISTVVTPIFREDVTCFESDSCFLLAFSVPAILMIIALIIFFLGRVFYKVKDPEGNVVLNVGKAIYWSLKRRKSEKKAGRVREHWLYYADDKYHPRFLEEITGVLRVLVLYLPLPLFWALFDQQGSRWTFQAQRMNGELGSYVLKPDQMQVLNPLLILGFIPFFDRGIYPLLGKCNLLSKPLQRLTTGGIFAGLAFVISGLLELKLRTTDAVDLTAGQTNIQFINTAFCPVNVTIPGIADEGKIINSEEFFIYSAISTEKYKMNYHCKDMPENSTQITIDPFDEKSNTYVFYPSGDEGESVGLYVSYGPDEYTKSEKSFAKINIRRVYTKFARNLSEPKTSDSLIRTIGFEEGTTFQLSSGSQKITFEVNTTNSYDSEMPHGETELKEVEPNVYQVSFVDLEGFETQAENITLETGGSYLLLVIYGSEDSNFLELYTITEPNSVHMLWLIPQYVVMSAGEIMFSITVMDFSYEEAPVSMKSVMQSAWLMTVAVGNLIVVIIAEVKIFHEQWMEFFLFAGLMFLDMILFSFMAYRYKPANLKDKSDEHVPMQMQLEAPTPKTKTSSRKISDANETSVEPT